MLLIAAGVSLMRGERYVHTDESLLEAVAREGDALASPAVPTEDAAFDDAVAGRPVTLADLRD